MKYAKKRKVQIGLLKSALFTYRFVQKIPEGRVVTYGMIADAVNLRLAGSGIKEITPRYVGYLLHKNPDPKTIPCHRVVNLKGNLAKNFAFGGYKGQRKKLEKENVKFLNEKRVDINKCLAKAQTKVQK